MAAGMVYPDTPGMVPETNMAQEWWPLSRWEGIAVMRQRQYRGLTIPEWIQVQWDTAVGKAWRNGVDMAVNTTVQEFTTQMTDELVAEYERQNRPRKKTKKGRLRRNN